MYVSAPEDLIWLQSISPLAPAGSGWPGSLQGLEVSESQFMLHLTLFLIFLFCILRHLS